MPDTSANSMWFYLENDERKGPIPFSQLQEKFLNLPDTSLVWAEGMGKWVPAKAISGLTATTSTSSAQITAFETGLEIPNPPIPLGIIYSLRQSFKYTLADLPRIFFFSICLFALSYGMLIFAQTIAPPTISYHPFGDTIVKQSNYSPFGWILLLIINILNVFLSLGAIRCGHKYLNSEIPKIADLFSQKSKLLSTLGAGLIFSIMVTIGLILLIVPGVIIFLRLGFFQQAIVEKNLRAIDSLKYSWELTKTNTRNLFGLLLLSILTILVGILCLAVGLVIALPVVFFAQLIAFRYLHRGKNAVILFP